MIGKLQLYIIKNDEIENNDMAANIAQQKHNNNRYYTSAFRSYMDM